MPEIFPHTLIDNFWYLMFSKVCLPFFLFPLYGFLWPNHECFHYVYSSPFFVALFSLTFTQWLNRETNRSARLLGRSLGDQPLQPSGVSWGLCDVPTSGPVPAVALMVSWCPEERFTHTVPSFHELYSQLSDDAMPTWVKPWITTGGHW